MRRRSKNTTHLAKHPPRGILRGFCLQFFIELCAWFTVYFLPDCREMLMWPILFFLMIRLHT